jgi:hypothetical protein
VSFLLLLRDFVIGAVPIVTPEALAMI